jgi:oligopeptide transport system substrate-binding protein
VKKILSLVLAACMLLGLGMSAASADELKEYHDYALVTSEMENFNTFHSQGAVDSNVLSNILDNLLTNDENGDLVACAAKEWSSPDGGKTWIFVLNDGMTWVDKDGVYKADVVANDWVMSLEWVLNYAKNDAYNTSMPIEMIVGANEYYEYTKTLTETEGAEAAMALGTEKFLEMVGIQAQDDKTLVYTCLDKFSYFPSVLTYNCFHPLSAKQIEEIGAEGFKNLQWDGLWSNGPYLLTSYVDRNEKILTKSPSYWNAENVKRFDTVTIKMVESVDVAFTLFQTGELDRVTLSASQLATISGSESNEFHDYLTETRPTKFSYQFHFQYDKKLESGEPDDNWNAAIANEAFRKSIYHGLDFSLYLARLNAIHPLACQNYAYTANNLCFTTDGVDYTQLVRDEIGLQYSDETYTRYDAEKGGAYKAQAMEELAAKGVTFPVLIDYYVQGSNQSAMDNALALKQAFSDCLGDEYIQLNIKTYISNYTEEVRKPQLMSMQINGWGADFADPANFLGQETYGEDNAYYQQVLGNINNVTDEEFVETYKEFTRLVNEARAITEDIDARYAAFAKAEAYMLDHVLTVPVYYLVEWQLTLVNDYSKIYAQYGIQSSRYVNWEAKTEPYTTAEYAELAAK